MMEASGVTNNPTNPEELEQYEQGWMEMMINIWQEQMRQLGCIDTGKLYASLTGKLSPGDEAYIQHSFPMYGIYVALGIGPEYKKDNGGDLKFLNWDYREEHGLDSPRKRGPKWGGGYTSGHPRDRNDWFYRKYRASVYKLNEIMEQYYGERGTYLLVKNVEALLGQNENKTEQ